MTGYQSDESRFRMLLGVYERNAIYWGWAHSYVDYAFHQSGENIASITFRKADLGRRHRVLRLHRGVILEYLELKTSKLWREGIFLLDHSRIKKKAILQGAILVG